MENEFKELRIKDNWTTEITLGGEPLDYSKYYDIKLPQGSILQGCRIWYHTHTHEGRGGMDESYTTITPFFEANGVESKLQSGFLMRVNNKVTLEQQTIKAKMARSEKIKYLYEQRDELNRQINSLEDDSQNTI